MTPRSLIGFGLLFVASFLVTWMINGSGGTHLVRTAQSTLENRQAPVPVRAGLPQAAGFDSSSSMAADAGPADESDLPADFDAVARDAVAGASSEERIRAVQVLAEAPAQQGMDALVAVSAQGADAAERATAITSLRQRAGGSGPDERIRNAFRQAAADPDPLVAVLAQSALEDIKP